MTCNIRGRWQGLYSSDRKKETSTSSCRSMHHGQRRRPQIASSFCRALASQEQAGNVGAADGQHGTDAPSR